MRVLIVNVHFDPASFGGATLVAEQNARGLIDRGHEVLVLTTTNDRRVPLFAMRRYDSQAVPVVAVRVPEGDDDYSSPRVAEVFGRVLEAYSPDVVHVHALQRIGVDCVELAQARGVPTVVTLHDAWWLCERQFMVRADGLGCGQFGIRAEVCARCVPDPVSHEARQRRSLDVLNSCTTVLAPSEAWATRMRASGVIDVLAHPNGVRFPAPGFRREPRVGALRFGYVGGTHPVKGYELLVEALNRLPRSDYDLHVVDASSNLTGVPSMNHRHWPVHGLVRLLPGYSVETMDEFYAGIDVLLFPSRWPESFGLTVREALVRGVWPVVTSSGGAAEVVEDGVNGTVVPVDVAPAEFAETIRSLLDEPPAVPVDGPWNSDRGILTNDEQTDDLVRILRAAH